MLGGHEIPAALRNATSADNMILGAALKIQDIATAHDQKAAQGTEPAAKLDYTVPIWDEMAQVISTISSEHPGLLAKLIEALADDAILEAHGSSKHMGDTVATTPSSCVQLATLLKFVVRIWSVSGSSTVQVIVPPFWVTLIGGPQPQS